MRPEWLAQTTEAARNAGEALGLTEWVGRLERVLLDRANQAPARTPAALAR
jgi:hypothetical protein